MRLAHLLQVLPFLAALTLVIFLIFSSGLTFLQFHGMITALSTAHISAFVLLSFGMLLLSAIKWRLVMQNLSASSVPVPTNKASFLYTCFGAALGLVLMPHVAKPAGRAIGARLHGAQPIVKTVAASAFEQLFDLAVIAAFACIGVALLAPAVTPVVVGLFVMGIIVALYLSKRPHLLPKKFHISELMTLVRDPIGLRLVSISLMMYVMTALRTGVIAIPMGISLLPLDFLGSFSIVQLSRLIAITPMELGIVDWTWAGVLSLFELPLSLAAGFVLVNRGLNALSILAALALSFVLVATERRTAT
ncbi:MAG: hypothetical protein AAF557_18510 [Pseudomonadota bacterium]